jgi:hypothetical protein
MAAHLSIPLNDMIFFAGVFAAAAWWRKRPDVHRRLMLVPTCLFTVAAFSRFPFTRSESECLRRASIAAGLPEKYNNFTVSTTTLF